MATSGTNGDTCGCTSPCSDTCVAPEVISAGKADYVMDRYECPRTIQPVENSVKAQVGERVLYADGSDENPINLRNLKGQSGACVGALVGMDSEGNIQKLVEDTSISGPQEVRVEGSDICLVPWGTGRNCFPDGEIAPADPDCVAGFAAFSACTEGDQLCLVSVDPCSLGSFVPTAPGTVIWFAGPLENIPDGYVYADGRSLNTNEYPELFAAIGYTWGGAAGIFQVPDYRNRHLRDADSLGIGNYQADAIQCHQHEGTYGDSNNSVSFSSASTTIGPGGTKTITYIYNVTLNDESTNNDIATASIVQGDCGETPRVEDETRVKAGAAFPLLSLGCTSVCKTS